MKIISKDILDAIYKMKLQLGTNVEVAKRLGMSSKHIGQILSEKVKYFEDKNWKRIEKIIKPYITLDSSPNFSLSSDEKEIIKFLRLPKNRRKKLELLIDIEDSKTYTYNSEPGDSYEVNDNNFSEVAEANATYSATPSKSNVGRKARNKDDKSDKS